MILFSKSYSSESLELIQPEEIRQLMFKEILFYFYFYGELFSPPIFRKYAIFPPNRVFIFTF